MTHEHAIRLIGDAANDRVVSGHLLRDLFDVLVRGAEQSLRYQLEGRSTSRGANPAWLRSASDFRMVDLSRDNHGRTLRLEARPLVDTMPERFAQADLFEDLDPRRSPLELFEDALGEALAEHSDSGAFDHPLLETCADFRLVLNAGLEAVEIENGRRLRIDRSSVERVVSMSKVVHARRKVRVAGRLDAIRYSDCRFILVLETGARIAGTAVGLGADALKNAFGENVLLTGTADFRPSGRLLRIEADAVEAATEKELKLFAAVPRPLLAQPIVEHPPERGGLAALLGRWPGEEPLEQLLSQLGALG